MRGVKGVAPSTSSIARIDEAVYKLPQERVSAPRYDRSPFTVPETLTSAAPTSAASTSASHASTRASAGGRGRGRGGRGRKTKETIAAEKAKRDAWLAPRRAAEQRAREQSGGDSSSAAAELEADGIACMGEQSRQERDVEGRAQAFDIEDSDSENEALGGGAAASQPVWGSQLDGSQFDLSASDSD